MRRVLLPLDFSPPAAPAGGALCDLRGQSMGTTWSARLVEPSAAAPGAAAVWRDGLQGRLDRVVAQMSHWDAQSDLGRFNRAEAGVWQSLPAEFCEVLGFALDVSRASGGAYDPGAGTLVNRWGFGPGRRFDQAGFSAPSPDQVAALLAAGGARRIELNAPARHARRYGDAQLDLSSVAKGYGVDCLARYLEGQGIHHYLVEVGGELRGAGVKPDGQPWWVGLEQVGDADADSQPGQMVLALHGLAVATSGDYRRYFTHGARRYSHTIDPRRGAPIVNDIASVTVVHEQCMAADAWSTALTVLGVEAGLALAERRRLAARFVVREGSSLREHLSSRLRQMLDQ